MNPDTPQAETPEAGVPPLGAGVLWAMRVLSAALLAIAALLLADTVFQLTTSKPFCGGPIFRCDEVLGHPRWSQFSGIPVTVPALLLYLGVAAILWTPVRRVRRAWWFLGLSAGALATAAVWFVGLQIIDIGALCPYCLVEHGGGVVLAALILVHGPARSGLGRGRFYGKASIGAAAMVVVALAQILSPGDYLEPVVTDGEYKEGGSAVAALEMAGGKIRLNKENHPFLGSPTATRVVVESIDFACPHCKRLNAMLKEIVVESPDIAVVVLMQPLNADCNPSLEDTDKRFVHSCRLSRVALAVWKAKPSAYAAFHAWLFENQDALIKDPAPAEARAAAVIGAERLTWADSDEAGNMLGRDLHITNDRLGITRLPGLFAVGSGNDVRFKSVPESKAVLADKLREAFAGGSVGAAQGGD